MLIKRIVMTIAVFVAVVSANAGTATAEPELPACQTTPYRSEVVHQWRTGSWGYLYRVIWCVENANITWAVQDVVPVLPDDSGCTWEGMAGDDMDPVGNSESWTGFTMGWFSCPDDPTDYPWGVILVHPDGTSEIAGQGTV